MQLRTQITPPAGVAGSRRAFEIIRLSHLHFYQHHPGRHLFFQFLEQQAVDLFRIIDDVGLAHDMEKKSLALAEEFQPYGELLVEFMEGLARTRYKKP